MRSISAKVTADVSVLRREMRAGSDEVKSLGKAVERTSKKASGDLDVMSKRALALEIQMQATRKATEGLINEFARSGDVTLLKRIDAQKKALKELQDARNLLPASDDIDRAGRGIGSRLAHAVATKVSAAVSDGLADVKASPIGTAAKTIGILVGAGLTPALGAAVAGAIIGGAGGLGVAGGLAVVSRDAKIQAAAKDLGQFIGDELQDAAAPFGPAVQKAIAQARVDFTRLAPDLQQIFAKSAPLLEPLQAGVTGFLEEVLDDLPGLLDAAGPVMDALETSLVGLGEAVGDVLEMIADNGPEAALGLETVFEVLEFGVRFVGIAINGLTELYGLLARNGILGAEVESDYLRYAVAQGVAAAAARTGAAAADGAAAALTRQREAAKAVSDQLRAEVDPVFNYLNAQNRLEQAQKGVADATKEHGKNSREAKEALRNLAIAALDVQSAAGQLGSAFDGRMTPKLRAALRAAGLTSGQINELGRQFRIAKAAGLDFARDYKARFIVEYISRGVNTVASAAERARAATAAAIAKEKRGRRYGGVDVAMAGGGMLSAGIYPASSPPLVKFAEPETGGELYVPRRGDTQRGRDLLSVGASWYGMRMVPMAGGGVASSSYVNVTPSAPARSGTRLDTASSMLSARNAVASLNTSLRENGKSFSLASAKGRENRAVLLDGIRAAQEAARAKYEETGSIKAANAVYDEYERRLRRVVRRSGASTSPLNVLGQRPSYDITAAAPSNSSGNIAYMRAKSTLVEARDTARAFFDPSWGKPTFGSTTAAGRDNLTALFDYLEAAEAAAQARYSQTGSKTSATRLYSSSLSAIRTFLGRAGMKKKEIDTLLGTYGRITLGNRWGGVYEHMADGGLRQAHIASAGPTRYAYAEPATGGELFAPKNGDLQTTRENVQWAVSNWWGGGQIPWGGGSGAGAGGGAMTIRVVVDDGQVAGLVRVEVDEALGSLASAQIYQTAS